MRDRWSALVFVSMVCVVLFVGVVPGTAVTCPATELEYFLSGFDRHEWRERFELDMFDCSEMSAALERVLENAGFNTIIVMGPTPFTTPFNGYHVFKGYHAWLLVEVVPSGWMPVEATELRVIFWCDPYFSNYFIFDRRFECAYEAFRYWPEEFGI